MTTKVVTIVVEEDGTVGFVSDVLDESVSSYKNGFTIEVNGVIIDVIKQPTENRLLMYARNPKLYPADGP